MRHTLLLRMSGRGSAHGGMGRFRNLGNGQTLPVSRVDQTGVDMAMTLELLLRRARISPTRSTPLVLRDAPFAGGTNLDTELGRQHVPGTWQHTREHGCTHTHARHWPHAPTRSSTVGRSTCIHLSSIKRTCSIGQDYHGNSGPHPGVNSRTPLSLRLALYGHPCAWADCRLADPHRNQLVVHQ